MLKKIGNWYARNERPISSLSLVGGFVFNAIFLTRVDHFWENFWIVVHLLIVAVCIILINREETKGAKAIAKDADPAKLHFWLTNVMQFTFGGMLSTYIVFYFRSAVLTVAWPFFLVLIIAFLANESLKRHYARLDFQISFFFLSTYLFMIFFLPVVLHEISQTVFLMSGGLSLIVLFIFLGLLRTTSRKMIKEGRQLLVTSIVFIFILINGFYLLGVIPPLPLTLEDAGIYHTVQRTRTNTYQVTHEPRSFWDKILPLASIYPEYHLVNGSAYAYSAIFSPLEFALTITHEWQIYDANVKRWITTASVDLGISGGRDAGYRTYSTATGLVPGKWRVNVKTPSGQLIGRMTFRVVATPPSSLITTIKD